MVQSSSEASPEAVAALAKLMQVILRPASRKAFQANPLKALQEAEINPSDIPPNVLDHLSELSLAELRLVSHLNTTLIGSGMKATARDGGTVAIL